MTEKTIRRNDPCPCGSNKRYKQCCGATEEAPQAYNPLPGDFQTALEHHQAGRLPQAEQFYHKIIHELPGHPDAPHFHRNLGDALLAQGKLDAAEASYQQALLLMPAYVGTYLNLGVTLHAQGKFDSAVDVYNRAIALAPNDALARNNLGLSLQEQGKFDGAIENYRQALTIKPDFAEAHSNLLFALSFHSLCSSTEYLEEAKRYDKKLLTQAKPYTSWLVYPVQRTDHGNQPLRVGLVSGDLRNHPVSFFLESALACLDPARVVLVAYSTNRQEDELTARIKPCFTAWNSIEGLNDETAARKIHMDGIHILIDLAAYSTETGQPVHGKVDSRSVATRGFVVLL